MFEVNYETYPPVIAAIDGAVAVPAENPIHTVVDWQIG